MAGRIRSRIQRRREERKTSTKSNLAAVDKAAGQAMKEVEKSTKSSGPTISASRTVTSNKITSGQRSGGGDSSSSSSSVTSGGSSREVSVAIPPNSDTAGTRSLGFSTEQNLRQIDLAGERQRQISQRRATVISRQTGVTSATRPAPEQKETITVAESTIRPKTLSEGLRETAVRSTLEMAGPLIPTLRELTLETTQESDLAKRRSVKREEATRELLTSNLFEEVSPIKARKMPILTAYAQTQKETFRKAGQIGKVGTTSLSASFVADPFGTPAKGVLTAGAFSTGGLAVASSGFLIGESAAEIRRTPSREGKLLVAGTQLAPSLLIGVGSVAKGLGKATKTVGLQLEARAINERLASQQKLVGPELFNQRLGRARLIEVEAEALTEATGSIRSFRSTTTGLDIFEYQPNLQRIRLQIDPQNPPIPGDFLFKGKGQRLTEIRALSGTQQGVSAPRFLREETFSIGGFGFPRSLERATKPLKLARITEGTGSQIFAGESTSFKIAFGEISLARGQSISPLSSATRASRTKGVRLGLPLPKRKGLGFGELPREGTIIVTDKGILAAPKGTIIKNPRSLAPIFSPEESTLIFRNFPVRIRRITKVKPGVKVAKSTTRTGSLPTINLGGPTAAATAQLGSEQILLLKKKKKKPEPILDLDKLFQEAQSKQQQVAGTKQKQAQEQKLKKEQGVISIKKIKLSKASASSSSKSSSQAKARGFAISLGLSQTPKLAQKPLQGVKTISQLKPAQDVAQVPKQTIAIFQRPRQEIKLELLQELRPIPRLRSLNIRTQEPVRVPKRIKLPKFKKSRTQKARRAKTSRDPFTRYTPTVVALEYGITGKKSKLEKEVFTGLGIRPIAL